MDPNKGPTYGVAVPSIWDLIHDNASSMVAQAVAQAQAQLSQGSEMVDGLRQRITDLLSSPLGHVAAWHKMGVGNHSVNEEIDEAVSGAVSQALKDFNITESTSNSSFFKEEVVKILDREIEVDVFNKVISNMSHVTTEDKEDFFHHLPFKDETLFVALLCMGIVLPIIIITLFLIYFIKHRRENIERSQEMLLQNQPEFSMDEYNTDHPRRGNEREEEVPDLVLRNFSI